MCGIVGKLISDRGAQVDAGLIQRMTASLRHRGPDAAGVWTDGGVGLGSRRLAVFDLSNRAAQLLANEDGAIRVVFNGEIYNFRELRAELEGLGHRFRSDTDIDTDTETIVHLYEEEGVDCVRTRWVRSTKPALRPTRGGWRSAWSCTTPPSTAAG